MRKIKKIFLNGGGKYFLKRGIRYIKKRIINLVKTKLLKREYKDILLVYSCEKKDFKLLKELLQFANIFTDEIMMKNLNNTTIKNYRLIIFINTLVTDECVLLINYIHNHNKKAILYKNDENESLIIKKSISKKYNLFDAMITNHYNINTLKINGYSSNLIRCNAYVSEIELKNYYNKSIRNKVNMIKIVGIIFNNKNISNIEIILREFPNIKVLLIGKKIILPQELSKYKSRIKLNNIYSKKDTDKLKKTIDIFIQFDINDANSIGIDFKFFIDVILMHKYVLFSFDDINFKRLFKNFMNNKDLILQLKKILNNFSSKDIYFKSSNKFIYNNLTTLSNSICIRQSLIKKMSPNIAFVVASTQISGGMRVILKHCSILKKNNYDIVIINESYEDASIKYGGDEFLVISSKCTKIIAQFDKMVATLWSTVKFVQQYSNCREKFYLVQGYETEFYFPGDIKRTLANQTYCVNSDFKYITISNWCKKWLKEKYSIDADYIPNGIDTNNFKITKRRLENKVKILIEGNYDNYIKNIGESFMIAELLDKDKYEIWYLTTNEVINKRYNAKKFFKNIDYKKVGEIYSASDILLKSSLLESFSYPPLEMMATGGYVVVAPNEGNIEYLENENNCLFYEQGNYMDAVQAIHRICKDKKLQETLFYNGLKTSRERCWESIENIIIKVYET